MLNIELQNQLHQIIQEIYSDNPEILEFIRTKGAKIEYPRETKFGDYSTPVSMQLSKVLKKNPIEIGEKIAESLSGNTAYQKVEVVKPGFINVFLSETSMLEELGKIRELGEKYSQPAKNGQKIIFEYVSANPTGPLHIGHARWAALGDTLSRLLKWAGYEVYREFYVNDAGVQVENLNKTVSALKKGEPIPEDGYHGEYVKDCLDYDGEPIDFFLNEQKETLAKFRVEFDNYFSEKKELHNPGRVAQTVEVLKQMGLTYDNENALWFHSEKFGDDKDRVLIKSDGSYTYFAPDIAYHKIKIDRGFHRIINFFGADHHGYIKRIKAAVDALSEKKVQFDVIIGQLVFLFRNGEPVKLSKRSGAIITLEEVMEEIGVDAMRYFLTMRKADTPLEFDIELAKSQSSDNPVFYIQYAFARMSSILKKVKEKNVNMTLQFKPEKMNEFERNLVVKALKYPEELMDAAQALEPHRVTNYLYDMTALFHRFYEECKVIDEENDNLTQQRLYIVFAIRQCLETLLGLLGVHAPERM